MQDVSNTSFWRDRLMKAKKSGYLHYSVYLANPKLWNEIFIAHKKIFDKEIKASDNVLDAGCGFGRLSTLFPLYTGIDISPDLLAEARKHYPKKKFIEGNLKSMPFRDKEFDIAVCDSIKGMIEGNLGIEEWELMAKELKRVAKRVLILEYGDTIKGSPENYEIL